MHWTTILDAELEARTPTQWYEESVRIPKISELKAWKRVELEGRGDFLCEFIAENDKEDRAAIARKWKYNTREKERVEATRLRKYAS